MKPEFEMGFFGGTGDCVCSCDVRCGLLQLHGLHSDILQADCIVRASKPGLDWGLDWGLSEPALSKWYSAALVLVASLL